MKVFKQINRALSFIPLEAAPDGGKNCLLPCSEGEGGADLLIQTNKYHKKSNRTLILIMQPLELH